jgi:hypothetical protein
MRDKLIPVAALFETWVCGPSNAGILGSNPAGVSVVYGHVEGSGSG